MAASLPRTWKARLLMPPCLATCSAGIGTVFFRRRRWVAGEVWVSSPVDASGGESRAALN